MFFAWFTNIPCYVKPVVYIIWITKWDLWKTWKEFTVWWFLIRLMFTTSLLWKPKKHLIQVIAKKYPEMNRNFLPLPHVTDSFPHMFHEISGTVGIFFSLYICEAAPSYTYKSSSGVEPIKGSPGAGAKIHHLGKGLVYFHRFVYFYLKLSWSHPSWNLKCYIFSSDLDFCCSYSA